MLPQIDDGCRAFKSSSCGFLDPVIYNVSSVLLLIGRVLKITLNGNLPLGRETNVPYLERNKNDNVNTIDFSSVVFQQTLRVKVFLSDYIFGKPSCAKYISI